MNKMNNKKKVLIVVPVFDVPLSVRQKETELACEHLLSQGYNYSNIVSPYGDYCMTDLEYIGLIVAKLDSFDLVYFTKNFEDYLYTVAIYDVCKRYNIKCEFWRAEDTDED